MAPAIRVKLSPRQPASIDTLVLYTFAASDPEYRANFEYFLEYGVGGDNVFYAIILQQATLSPISRSQPKEFGQPGRAHCLPLQSCSVGRPSPSSALQMSEDSVMDMPDLPKNAKYIHHKNECFDWGTFGWAIGTNQVDVGRYKFIIFLNSSVRGPFIPPYWPVRLHSMVSRPKKYSGQLGLVSLQTSGYHCMTEFFEAIDIPSIVVGDGSMGDAGFNTLDQHLHTETGA